MLRYIMHKYFIP